MSNENLLQRRWNIKWQFLFKEILNLFELECKSSNPGGPRYIPIFGVPISRVYRGLPVMKIIVDSS
jgi:hypothetical protein